MTRVTKRLFVSSLSTVFHFLQYDHGELDQVENHVYWLY